MAGTGGTTSSSFLPAELYTFREPFKVGKRELEDVGVIRGPTPALGGRIEVKLDADDKERLEPIVLRMTSGEIRAEDGVTLFLGTGAGERATDLVLELTSS